MSKEKRRVPKLRFPGFTEDWEQRKADYIFKSITDKGYPELPVLSASQELGMVYRNQNGIDIQHDKKNEATYKRVLPGQFVIHLRSFQGGFAYSEVEGITSPAYTVMSFKNSSEQYGLFWKHVFKSETFIKRLETITYGIRDGRSISFSDFKSLILQYPSYSEQKLIGDSIALIERGITLHQRKLEHLNLKKKALLQKLFPKNGECYPELRFPGFTDAWEQCKLGSLASVEMNKRIFKEQTTTNGDIPFYKIGTFGSDADSFISRELFEEYKNKYPYPNIGDILISASGSIGRTVVYNGEDAYFQDSNIVWLNHNGKIDNSFLLQFYNQVKWAGLEGSTIKRLYNKNILETNIALPKIEEQRLIGKFFTLVDSTITLHQRKLDHLQLQKKALLQQMFV
mgnify:CR=1 FL=1